MTEKFSLEQIWAQIDHHTSQVNGKLMQNLVGLVETQDQEGGLKLQDDEITAAMSASEEDDEDMEEEEAEDEMEENAGKGGIEGDYGDEEGNNLFEKDSEEVSNFMQDMEEEEMNLDGLKLPNQDEDEESYGGEEGEDE